MVDIEYSNAYTEVYEILKHVSKKDYEKIPEVIIELFSNNRNIKYNFSYDASKRLEEQIISKKAKTIIAILFRDYWATPEQRKRIIAKQNFDRMQTEKEKQTKYNTEELFKNRNKPTEIQ